MRRRRRAVLAALAAGTTGLAGGCLDQVGDFVGSGPDEQVSLQVKVAPADTDPFAAGIAQRVSSWLRTAGLSAQVVNVAAPELHAQVLDDHAFDLFVSRVPGRYRDPDALYSLLHSTYAASTGWNNPFGVTEQDLDDQLEAQRRRAGSARAEAVEELATVLAEQEPFSVVCFPEEIRAARHDRFAGFSSASLEEPTGFLALERAGSDAAERDDGSGPRADRIHLATTDPFVTETLNPLVTVDDAAAAIIGLLYDPLGRQFDDGIDPWLAEDWTVADDGPAPSVTVRLRPDEVWHDDEPVTADDVAFTYAFLADTRLADAEDSIPVAQFLDRTSLVESVRVVDERTARIRFVECDPAVAVRALTVPILPEHVWRERANPTNDDGEDGATTDVLELNNVPPVGSGPLSFVGNVPGERLTLSRNADHFLTGDDLSPRFDRFAGGPPFERFVLEAVGANTAAVELTVSGQADATFTPLPPRTVPRIGRAEELRLYTDSTDAFYLVGYNARRTHLSNPQFRAVLGGLLDRDHLVRSVFEGYGTPAASPLSGTRWLPEHLEWDGTDPVTPFLGSDGELAVERVRDAFRDVGYRYDGDALVTR